MAAKITHLEILKQALVLMEHEGEKARQVARLLSAPHLNRFACLGSVAPDIFYFYHILSKKKNARAAPWGNRSHHQRVLELVLCFLDRVRQEPPGLRRDKQLAFALGYACHCTVDIITHPYIFYFTGNYYADDAYEATEAQENHLRVEYALDSYIVDKRWGMHPHRYDYEQYLDCREKFPDNGQRNLDYDVWSLWVSAFATVFPEEFANEYHGLERRIIEEDIVNESYLGFMKFNRMVDARSPTARFFLRALDTASMHRWKTSYLILPHPSKIDPRIPNESHAEWKYPADPERTSTESFMDLIHRSAKTSCRIMLECMQYLDGSRKRKDMEKEYSGYNLDTGVRSESLHMTEFQPLREGSEHA